MYFNLLGGRLAQFGITPTGHEELLEHNPLSNVTEANIQSPIHLANLANDSSPIRHIPGSISPASRIEVRLSTDSLHYANNHTGGSSTLSDRELSLLNHPTQIGEVAAVPSLSTVVESIAFSTMNPAPSRDDPQLIGADTVIGGSQPHDSELQLPFPSLPPGGWDEQGNPIFCDIPRPEPSLPERARSELAFDEWVSDEQVAPDTAVLPPSLSRFELQQPRLTVPQPHLDEQGHSNPTPQEPAPDLYAADEVLADFSFFDIFGEPGPAGLASTTPAIAERAEAASRKRATPEPASPEPVSTENAPAQSAPARAPARALSARPAFRARMPIIVEREFRDKYCKVKCLGKSRAQNKRKKEGKPATRAGGGGSKKGDVGGRKKRDGNGKGSGAAGAVLNGRVQKAA
ncbi:hypothetical protein NEUTE1DRAFT_110498 [Neurospora tetrasperma FGSC 2508]|uniref:Uncharacterized protein n=1 Tax=Neurospora tetrasperma (strain FGSC 2508 / ATCC MYA-4615 / P0657) TaxID=510951 RepID=F8MLB2_NEUT8|nr:uncharacterized protein NEUTE1DRAFT_110498 [Neurospora tetrasperma FGSC 2508]EGO58385.1 hypothetical protein NEUTE1DRAFT_110498 [Neurospora tetrasperma FGSC 2508]EGZ71286.1 hypothetical protein NEUTE2DRAFT_138518 [Neurospora tetrasperma FGSC 2509]